MAILESSNRGQQQHHHVEQLNNLHSSSSSKSSCSSSIASVIAGQVKKKVVALLDDKKDEGVSRTMLREVVVHSLLRHSNKNKAKSNTNNSTISDGEKQQHGYHEDASMIESVIDSVIDIVEKEGTGFLVHDNILIGRNHAQLWTMPDQQGEPCVPRPWCQFGKQGRIKLNTEWHKKIKQAVLSLVMSFPGISEREVHFRFSFLSNSEMRAILRELEDGNQLVRRSIKTSKPSLFSAPTDLSTTSETKLLFTTLQCV